MTNAGHAGFDTLVAYWLDELDAEAESRLDGHLLECEACGRALDEVMALAAGVREAFTRGAVHAFVPESFVKRLEAGGAALRVYRLAPGDSVHCTILPADRFVVSRLEAPLAGVRRVDATVEAQGQERQSFRDVPFDAASGTVTLLPAAEALRAMPTHTERVRLVAVDEGGERELGTYTFHHARHGG